MQSSDMANLRYWQDKYNSMDKRMAVTWNKALDAAEAALGQRHTPLCPGRRCLPCMCAQVLDKVRKQHDDQNDMSIVERLAKQYDLKRSTIKVRGIARDKYLEGMQDMLRMATEIIGDLR